MNILLQSGSYYKAGGTNTFVRGLSKALAEDGHKTLVICHRLKEDRYKNETINKNLKIVYYPQVPRKKYFLPFYFLRFLIMFLYNFYWISKEKIQIILVGETEAMPFLPFRLFGKKVIIRGGSPLPTHLISEMRKEIGSKPFNESIIRFYEKIILFFANSIIALSAWEIEILAKYSSKKPLIIPYAVDTKFYSPGNKKQKALVYVGRIAPIKSIDELIMLFNKIRKKVNVKLWLLGPLDEHYSKDKLLSLSDYPKAIKFLGQANPEKVSQYYKKSLVFVQTAHDLGNSPIEAAASGLPVVAKGRFPEKYCISADEKGFIESVIKLVKDKKFYERISKFNRNYVVNNNSWRVIASKYEQAFMEQLK